MGVHGKEGISDSVPTLPPNWFLISDDSRIADEESSVFTFPQCVVVLNYDLVVHLPHANTKYICKGSHYHHPPVLCVGGRVICANTDGYLSAIELDSGQVVRSMVFEPCWVRGIQIQMDSSGRFLVVGRRKIDPITLQIADAAADNLPVLSCDASLPDCANTHILDLPDLAQHTSYGASRLWSRQVFEAPFGTVVVSNDKRTSTRNIHWFAGTVVLSLLVGTCECDDAQLSFTNMAGVHVYDLQVKPAAEFPSGLWKDLAQRVNVPQEALRLILPDNRIIKMVDAHCIASYCQEIWGTSTQALCVVETDMECAIQPSKDEVLLQQLYEQRRTATHNRARSAFPDTLYPEDEYDCGYWKGIPILKCKRNGVKMLASPIWLVPYDTSLTELQIVHHFTDELGFPEIVSSGSLRMSRERDRSHFGAGGYAVLAGPSSWESQDHIICNNFWPRRSVVVESEHDQVPMDARLVEKWSGRAEFCVAFLTKRVHVYDVHDSNKRLPDMQDQPPSHNRWGEEAGVYWHDNSSVKRDVLVLSKTGNEGQHLEEFWRSEMGGRDELFKDSINCDMASKGVWKDAAAQLNALGWQFKREGEMDQAKYIFRALCNTLSAADPIRVESILALGELLLEEAEPQSVAPDARLLDSRGLRHQDFLDRIPVDPLAINDALDLFKLALTHAAQCTGWLEWRALFGEGVCYLLLGLDATAADSFEPLAQKNAGSGHHPRVLQAILMYAECLSRLGRRDEALALYNYTMEKRVMLYGEAHPLTRQAYYKMKVHEARGL